MVITILILGAALIFLLFLLYRVTRKVNIKSTSIINRIERIPELSTAKLTITQVYETEKKSMLPGLSGKYTMIIPVTAGGIMNLSKLSDENLEVNDSNGIRRIKIKLPLPYLEITVLIEQFAELKVINESGMLIRLFGKKDMLSFLKNNADEIRNKVIEESTKTGLIEIAKDSARNFFRGLLLGMGFDEAIIYFQESPLDEHVSPLKIEERV